MTEIELDVKQLISNMQKIGRLNTENKVIKKKMAHYLEENDLAIPGYKIYIRRKTAKKTLVRDKALETIGRALGYELADAVDKECTKIVYIAKSIVLMKTPKRK